MVARCRLAAEDEAPCHGELRVAAQTLVERDDVQHVQVLALVLMMRLTWISNSACGSTTTPVRLRMRCASASLFNCLTWRHRSWNAATGVYFEALEPRQR